MRRLWALVSAITAFLWTSAASAEVFNVASPAQFQNALTVAGVNDQADTINVVAGTFAVGPTLAYLPRATENFGLTIVGAPNNATVLDGGGGTQILVLNTLGTADANATLVVQGLSFVGGSGGSGGALSVQAASANVAVQGNVFDANAATADGGGCRISTTDGAIVIASNRFLNNTAGDDGGGLRAVSLGAGTVLIRDNVFTGNVASRDGGGARGETSSGVLTLVNNIVSGNTATGDGGGLRIESINGAIHLINSTVISNTAGLTGGGAIVKLTNDAAVADLANNIIHDNAATASPGSGDIFLDNNLDNAGAGSPVRVSNNDLTLIGGTVGGVGGVTLANNIDAPPQLSASFHLRAGSPCIDAGLNAVSSLPDQDRDGQARLAGGAVDIGADEYHLAVFNVTNAVEFQSALTTAGSDTQDDVINVAAGDVALAGTLTYLPVASEDFALSILGAPSPLGPAMGTRVTGNTLAQDLVISTLAVAGDASAHVLVRELRFANGRGAAGGALSIQTAAANVTRTLCLGRGFLAGSWTWGRMNFRRRPRGRAAL